MHFVTKTYKSRVFKIIICKILSQLMNYKFMNTNLIKIKIEYELKVNKSI